MHSVYNSTENSEPQEEKVHDLFPKSALHRNSILNNKNVKILTSYTESQNSESVRNPMVVVW